MKILDHFEQGSAEWLAQRVGRVTMSRAKDLLTGGRGVTRQNYILDLVAERLANEPIEGYSSIDMERGTFLEEWAAKAFSEFSDLEVKTVGFVLHNDDRIGCSPDGLIGDDAGVEIKCPRPRQHIRNCYAGGMDDYSAQVQGSMWVCERDHWYVVSFCPWVAQHPLHVVRVDRDESIISKLAESAVDAADQVDAMVNQALLTKTHDSVANLAVRARDAWDNVLASNSEVRL